MKSIKSLILIFVFFYAYNCGAQLLTNLDRHHNQVFLGVGYTQSFGNISYGINHSRYFKRLKKTITGILDFSSPISPQYYTRFILRKGFQLSVYQKNNFQVPIACITSSVRRHLIQFNFHDIITDFYAMPGWYTKKYTLAADLSLMVLWLHRTHFNDAYYRQTHIPLDPNKFNHFNACAGLVVGYHTKHITYLLKGGYQQVTEWEFNKSPLYIFGMIGYNFNFKRETPKK